MTFLRSYKTTIMGILLPILAFLSTQGLVSADTSTLIMGILAGLGLVVAKDGDKSTEDVQGKVETDG